VVPTAAGARLLEAGKSILQICNSVKAELKNIATPKLLRIGVLHSLSNFQVRTLALVAEGMGVSFIPAGLGTPGVKRVQVPDLGFFRASGLLWRPEREDDCLNQFIAFAERHCVRDGRAHSRPYRHTPLGTMTAHG
jgi:DNA-binding transcriptional LysR family regulator